MPVIVYHVRGLVVTLVGSALIVGMAIVDVVVPRVVALVGQVGQLSPTSPAFVGTVGIAVGLVTAVGGIAIQICDRLNARRRADQDYKVRYYLVRKNYKEIVKYSRDSYKYILDLRTICDTAGIRVPIDIGPPPTPIVGGPGDSDDYPDGNFTPTPPPKS